VKRGKDRGGGGGGRLVGQVGRTTGGGNGTQPKVEDIRGWERTNQKTRDGVKKRENLAKEGSGRRRTDTVGTSQKRKGEPRNYSPVDESPIRLAIWRDGILVTGWVWGTGAPKKKSIRVRGRIPI